MDRIPEISDERLAELYGRIKPVVQFNHKRREFPDFDGWNLKDIVPTNDDGLLYYIEDVDPRVVAFTWEPKPIRLAYREVQLLDAIMTRHTWAYYGFFKPAIAEVLAQIPEEYLDKVVAFQTLTGITAQNIVGDYHVTITLLYEKKTH